MHKKSFHTKVKNININTGEGLTILLNEHEARRQGIKAVDKVTLIIKNKEVVVNADLTKDLVDEGEIGFLEDIQDEYPLPEGTIIKVFFTQKDPLSVKAVRKKLLGKSLTEEEIRAIIQDMTDNKLSDTLTTYYAASSYFYPSNQKELYLTAKYSAEMGEMITFDNISAVKYSIGGVPGNETTMIIVPILASLGIHSPKTFSKAITSPAATGECVETLMEINFTSKQMKQLVQETNACLAWGKNLNFAPANDKIIQVSHPIAMEAYAKMVVSIMAKIYAGGTTHFLIDLPVGPTAKIKDQKTAKRIKKHFEYIGKHLGMKTKVAITNGNQPLGQGVGAILQVRDVLRILQQHSKRPQDLEKKALYLAGELLKLTGKYKGTHAHKIACKQLVSGKAREKMQEIIKAQNKRNMSFENTEEQSHDEEFKHLGIINSELLPLAPHHKTFKALSHGKIDTINISILKEIARTLGCPMEYEAGVFLHQKAGDYVGTGDKLFTVYSRNPDNIKRVSKLLKSNTLFEIK